jgi:hypothetical protein
LHVHGRGARTDICGRSFAVLSTRVFYCWLAPAARSAKTDACGRSFAVLSTQVSTAGLRLRHNMLTCGSMLLVSRDAVAAEEEQLVSCAAEQRKY